MAMRTIRILFILGLLTALMLAGCDFVTRMDSEIRAFSLGDEQYFEFMKDCENVGSYLQVGMSGPSLIEIYPRGERCVVLYRGDAEVLTEEVSGQLEIKSTWNEYKCVFDRKDYRKYGTENSIKQCAGFDVPKVTPESLETACESDLDCVDSHYCESNKCKLDVAIGCESDEDCPDRRPYCDMYLGMCSSSPR